MTRARTAFFGLLACACASRSVPAEFPPTSAASERAPEAQASAPSWTLREDPPLPSDGAAVAHWPGLVASGSSAHALAGAPELRALSADEAVRFAIDNNRELAATLHEMGIARGDLMQARTPPNPVFEAELLPERNTTLEMRVEYDITGAILATLRAHAAAPEVEAAHYRIAARVVELGYRVRAAFYSLQAAEQRASIFVRALDALAADRDAARALAEAGNVNALELATREAAYERARVGVAEVELEVALAREATQRVLGAHGAQTAWRVEGELRAADERAPALDDVETRAVRASLALKEAREHLELLARRAGVTRTAGWLPDVAVDVHGLEGNPSNEPGASSDRAWRFGGGVRVGVPLFDRLEGSARALEAEFDAARERYAGRAVDIRSRAREARARVESARARAIQYQHVIVPAQRRVTEQMQLQYNAMQLDLFALLGVRRAEFDVDLAYVETLREYWSAVAELDAILAGADVRGAHEGD